MKVGETQPDSSLLELEQQSRRTFLKSCIKIGAAAVVLPLIGCPNPVTPPTNQGGAGTLSFDVAFSEPMDTASVKASMSISPDIPGFFASDPQWSESNTKMHCEGTAGDTTTEYTVTIGADAKDLAGNLLDGNNDGTGGEAYSFTARATSTALDNLARIFTG